MLIVMALLPPAAAASMLLIGIILSSNSFHAAAWFLWLSSTAALKIASITLCDLGDVISLALNSAIAAASPGGLPSFTSLPGVLAIIADFLGLPLLAGITSDIDRLISI